MQQTKIKITCLLSQLLSKVTVDPAVFTSDVQCVRLAAGRRTPKSIVTEGVLFSIAALKTLTFHKVV